MSDIDTVVVDSLKALDPEWPIREADIVDAFWHFRFVPKRSLDHLVVACEFRRQHFEAERPLTGVRFVMDRRQFLGVSAQYPLRTARRVWRTVVLATQTPLTRVLPAPQAAATCVINSFFASINRPDARQLRPVALAQLSPPYRSAARLMARQ